MEISEYTSISYVLKFESLMYMSQSVYTQCSAFLLTVAFVPVHSYVCV